MSSDSDDEYATTRYVNKKVRSTIEVEITDLVTAGFVVKDNPASSSVLEDSLALDLDQAAKKLGDAKARQDQLQAYLDVAQAVRKGKSIKPSKKPLTIKLLRSDHPGYQHNRAQGS